MNLKKDRRKGKRLFNYLMKKCGYGKLVIDCRNHPCTVTRMVPYDGCDVKSLINGESFSCSFMHCGVEPISKDEADEMVRLYKDGEPWIPPRLLER